MPDTPVIAGLVDPPARRYTHGGRHAHLLVSDADLRALCGYRPRDGARWLGTSSQQELARAVELTWCAHCARVAAETGELISELRAATTLGSPA